MKRSYEIFWYLILKNSRMAENVTPSNRNEKAFRLYKLEKFTDRKIWRMKSFY